MEKEVVLQVLLLTLFVGIVIGVALSYIWRRWREEIIKFLMTCVVVLSLGAALGSLAALAIGASASIHRPDSSAMCWVVMVAGLAVALFFGFLLWSRSRKTMLRQRETKRRDFNRKLEQACF